MKTLIVYDSVFGNTMEIAKAIASGAIEKDKINIIKISDFSVERLIDIQLLIVGSPTRGFRPTKAISEFLKTLPSDKMNNIKIATFDTRIDLETIKNKFFRFLVDNKYAAKPISKALIKKGGKLISEPQGFLVSSEQGPLKKGEIERAAEWGKQIINTKILSHDKV